MWSTLDVSYNCNNTLLPVYQQESVHIMLLAILHFELFLHFYVHFGNAITKRNIRRLLIHYINDKTHLK